MTQDKRKFQAGMKVVVDLPGDVQIEGWVTRDDGDKVTVEFTTQKVDLPRSIVRTWRTR